MIFEHSGQLDSVKFVSLRTGETMLYVHRHGPQWRTSGTTPPQDIRLLLLDDRLQLTGSISDSQGTVHRLHEDGEEEHLADAHIEVTIRGDTKRIFVKGRTT